jgi:hypothetical protein
MASSSVTDWCTLRTLTGVGQAHRAARHGVFDAAHDQLGTQFLGACVAKIGHLMEVVAGVNHQQRVGDTTCGGQRPFQRT